MAKFTSEIPNDLIHVFDELDENSEKMMSEMTNAGAEVVYQLVLKNMAKAFKDVSRISKNVKITKVYKTPSDDGINTKVGIYGYLSGTAGKAFTTTRKKGGKTKKYTYNNGTPAPFVALAREYGTAHGESRYPFFKKSFKKSEIEAAMKEVEKKYLPKDE